MVQWLSHLRAERRLSPKTLEAYARDLRQCLTFLNEHWGARVTLKGVASVEASDIRAFMAMRRADDIAGRSLMRTLAGLRSFGRFLEREGKGKVGALSAIRSPKVGKSLPKPIQVSAAKRLADADERAGETRETWILARDAAVMALLYGSGLRISEALGLKRRDVPRPGEGDVLIVTGKGNKTRMVPVLQNVLALIADYVAICPYPLGAEGPVFVGARGGPLSPRIIQLAMARRRSARDPGTARPRLALDHADLHRHRQRAVAGGLSQHASARLTGGRCGLTLFRHMSLASSSGDCALGSPLLICSACLLRNGRLSGNRASEKFILEGIMSAHESMEQAEHVEHASGENRKIALLIAVIALCLALSETLGKGAQTESISKNVEASNLWAFFQAKSIRRTVVQATAEHAKLSLGTVGDEASKAALQKQIDDWNKTAARYRSEPETGEGSEELAKRAKNAEHERDEATAKYHHYEIASAAFQIGIVLASATIITGMIILAWGSAALALMGIVITVLGLYSPHLLHLH